LVVGWLVVGWLLVGCWLVVGWLLVGCWLVVGLAVGLAVKGREEERRGESFNKTKFYKFDSFT